ncbi:alanine acetyltransferase [Stenotrophomonas acidaminiphila]|nr:alanine acetyltransferase [Stenotrophomonas acidaminiphila]WHL20659.1 alanine acetyltransferase [Stenotrophomonas acidaminiphila]
MGYAVYLEGGALDAPLPQPQTRAAAPAALEAAPAAAPTRAPPPVRREAPPRLPPEAPATAPQARPAPRRGGVRLPDRLQIALLRASGCNPNDPQTRALMDSWPLDELRANPAAKRALWPQLRELRRKQRR